MFEMALPEVPNGLCYLMEKNKHGGFKMAPMKKVVTVFLYGCNVAVSLKQFQQQSAQRQAQFRHHEVRGLVCKSKRTLRFAVLTCYVRLVPSDPLAHRFCF